MVSSHILPELADMCNKVGIIEKGVLTENSDVNDLIKRVRPQVILRIAVVGPMDAAAKLIMQYAAVDRIEPADGQLVVTLKPGVNDYSELATLLVTNGQKLTMFKEDELNLEGAFMALTKGATA
jgi:ABC-2 type transport system ATP-binding protein